MTNRRSSLTLAALVVAIALGHACATSKDQSLPSFERSNAVTATATVKAVDQQSRQVTLVGDDGKPFTFVAGPEVRNLAQVKVGDRVKVQYNESLAVTVKREEGVAPEASASAGMTRAAPGERPAGSATSVVNVSAKIAAIDRETNRVTLVFPDGNYRTIVAREPKHLENVQIGDMVHATYTETIGISVEPIPAAPAK